MNSALVFTFRAPYREGRDHDIICVPGNLPSRESGEMGTDVKFPQAEMLSQWLLLSTCFPASPLARSVTTGGSYIVSHDLLLVRGINGARSQEPNLLYGSIGIQAILVGQITSTQGACPAPTPGTVHRHQLKWKNTEERCYSWWFAI